MAIAEYIMSSSVRRIGIVYNVENPVHHWITKFKESIERQDSHKCDSKIRVSKLRG